MPYCPSRISILILIHRRQVERRAQQAGTTLVEHRPRGRDQKIAARRKIRNALVERNCAATGNRAIRFSLGTLVERAQPAEIAITLRLEQKHVNLMAGDARADPALISFAQGAIAYPTQLTESMLRIDPKSQIEVPAFVPNLDPLFAKL